jgi:hypothetical protein
MEEISTGDRVEHEVYKTVEIYGFITVSDEVEVHEIEKDEETVLDVSSSIQSMKIEFLDQNGEKHVEPLKMFYAQTNISSYGEDEDIFDL